MLHPVYCLFKSIDPVLSQLGIAFKGMQYTCMRNLTSDFFHKMDPPGLLIRALTIVSNSVYGTCRKESSMPMLSSAKLNMWNVWVQRVERWGVMAKRACRKGVVDSAMDWCGRKFASLHRGLPTPSKGFFLLLTATHVFWTLIIYAVNMLLVLLIFFSSAG